MPAPTKARPHVGDWATRAACRAQGVDMFPDAGDPEAMRAALAVCAECPVRVECLRHAVEHDELYGIWGGTTQRARQRIRIARTRR